MRVLCMCFFEVELISKYVTLPLLLLNRMLTKKIVEIMVQISQNTWKWRRPYIYMGSNGVWF